MRHRWLTEAQFGDALREMVATYNRLGFPEPIPFPTEDRISRAGGLVAAANEPVFGFDRFETLNQKVAYVFYELVKQHFFVNGNKRIATYFLLLLLEIHSYSLTMRADLLADFAEWVAASDPARRSAVLTRIENRLAADLGPVEGWSDAEDLYDRKRETRKHRRY